MNKIMYLIDLLIFICMLAILAVAARAGWCYLVPLQDVEIPRARGIFCQKCRYMPCADGFYLAYADEPVSTCVPCTEAVTPGQNKICGLQP